jgi:hypothetical protein
MASHQIVLTLTRQGGRVVGDTEERETSEDVMAKTIDISVRIGGVWEIIDGGPADPAMKNLDGFQINARDIGSEIGQLLRVELWDDEGVIDVVEITAS